MKYVMTAIGIAALSALGWVAGQRIEKNHKMMECEVSRVEGTFYTERWRYESGEHRILLYRFTPDKTRSFMFESERVMCKGASNVWMGPQ